MSEAPNSGLQELREGGYGDVADLVAKMAQQSRDWDIRNGFGLTKNYIERKLRLEAYLSVRVDRQAGPPENYRVEFQFSADRDLIGNVVEISAFLANLHNLDLPAVIPHGCPSTYGKCAVLVDVVQGMETPKGVLDVIVPSHRRLSRCERLERINANLGDRGHASDQFFPLLSVLSGVFENREGGVFDLRGCHAGGVVPSDGQNDVVQGGPQIEKAVSHNDAEACRTIGFPVNSESAGLASVVERLRRWFRIWLVNDAIGFSLCPSSALYLEAIKVFARPL